MGRQMLLISIFFAALAAGTAMAQMPGTPAPVIVSGGDGELPPPGAKAGMVTMRVDDMDAEPVKAAPFCATISTEHTQTFADGNRIHTNDSASLCRDSDGRTRREASLNLLGAASRSSVPKLITIVDPVAGFRYMLDAESRTAHRMTIGPSMGPRGGAINVVGQGGAATTKGEKTMIYQSVGTEGPNMIVKDVVKDNVFFKKTGQVTDESMPATESLGDGTIDGIHATGTRLTTTIPAGKMGNEQPILVTSERWYSPELKATVMTKHNDPWAGELKTQFTNVNTSEPDSSLFTVPSDYKIVDEKARPFVIQKRLLAPPLPPQ
jgi:hypothetical protein